MIKSKKSETLTTPMTPEEALELNLRIDYKAFAFDIDGTIKDAKGLDEDIMDLIEKVNKSGRWVLFLTNGVPADHQDLIIRLSQFPFLAKVKLYFENGDLEGFFDSSNFVTKTAGSTLTELQLELVREGIEIALKSRTNSICFRVAELVNSFRSQGLKVLDCGNGDLTISFSGFSKGQTLSSFCDKQGININEVFKIGDQPQEGGNDHDFLNTPGSFTCGEINTDSFFPSRWESKEGFPRGTPVTFEILNKILTKNII